ncbi:peptidase [Clostridia bacterium]|nr:peptidase [Clostridia bacterium]
MYRHASGAELIHISNADKNRVFGITFRTLPFDNTGVFHILEHSVLCGSRKYPLKDPFFELHKGTLYSYLNAMTFNDKTMYPVAGTNEKDFFKMADVYADAVFNPLLLQKKEIMLQEGWRHEIGAEGQISGYGGIVYNEMRGSFAEADEYLRFRVYEKLLDGTPYMYDSGGVPEHIPTLTFENLCAAHRNCYTPQNAHIYLYGDILIEKYIEYIENNYLNKAANGEKQGFAADYSKPKNLDNFTVKLNSKIDYGCIGIFIDAENSPKLILGFSVLCLYLFRLAASPVKILVQEEKLCADLVDYFDFHMQKSVLTLNLKECSDAARAKEKIFSLLEKIAKNGLDKNLLSAALNMTEFQIKEKDYGQRPVGLQYLINISTQWIYGKDPFSALSPQALLEEIKNTDGFFEELIQTHFIQNRNIITAQAVGEKISEEPLNFDKADIDGAFSDKKILDDFHDTPDGETAVLSIPVLNISDISKNAAQIPFEKEDNFTKSNLQTDGISYLQFIFDISLDADLLRDTGVLSYLLGKLSTKNYRFDELNHAVTANLGSLTFSQHRFISIKDGEFKPRYIIKASVLDGKLEKAFELAGEIIFNTLFSDEKRLLDLLGEYAAKMHTHIINSGHLLAVTRASAALSREGIFDEICSGVSFYNYVRSYTKDNINTIRDRLKRLCKMIFRKSGFSFHVTGNGADVSKHAANFYDNLYEEDALSRDLNASYGAKSAFVLGTNVFHNALVLKYDRKYNAMWDVLAGVVNSDYLCQNIRVNGGAYGYGCNFLRTGYAYFYSYRDPNLERTFDVFKETYKFARGLKLSERELRQQIIGAVRSLDRPQHAEKLGNIALNRFLSDISEEDVQREREQILGASLDKLITFADMLEPKEYAVSTFGGTLETVKDAYEDIFEL